MGMNWPNRLTVARMIMAPVFMGLLLSSHPGCRYAAFAVFLAASLTDFVDGYLARRHGWVSNLGKFLDPLADKLLVSLAFIGLSQLSLVPSGRYTRWWVGNSWSRACDPLPPTPEFSYSHQGLEN